MGIKVQKLVSIILYAEDKINFDKTIDSIINQTFDQYEVIIVHDMFPSKAFLSKLKKLCTKHSFKLIQNQYNEGEAINPFHKGQELVTADYVMFLNTNDIYNTNTLDIVYNQAIGQDAELVLCDFDYYDYYTYKDLSLYNAIENIKTTTINNKLPYILNDFYLCNKLFKKSVLDEYNLNFIVATSVARLEFIYHYYLLSKKTIAIDSVLVYKHRPIGKELYTFSITNEINIFIDLIYVYNTIDVLFEKYFNNTLTKKNKNEYILTLNKTRLYALFNELYKYFWNLTQPVKLLIKAEILKYKNKFNTTEWQEISDIYFSLPLDSLPTLPSEMLQFSEVTVAIFGGYLNSIDCVIDTILSLYQSDLVRFNILVPKYIFTLLPREIKTRKNIQFIDDYGKNSFYNKALKRTTSPFIMFTQGGYVYDYCLFPMYHSIYTTYNDIVSAPIYCLDENYEKTILEYSQKGFNNYHKNNFSIDTDDIYDCILPNKITRVDYLRSLEMTFDGYDFTSALEMMKNGNIIRFDMSNLLLLDKTIEEDKFKYIDINHVRIVQDEISKTFLFADLIGKEMVQNLLCLRNYMLKSKQNIAINYYYENLKTNSEDEPIDIEKISKEYNELASVSDTVITAHNIMDYKNIIKSSAKTAFVLPAYEKVTADEYDYIFSHGGINETHFDFFNTGTPIVEYMNNEKLRIKTKDTFIRDFPQAANKTIVFISSKRTASSIMKNIDLEILKSSYSKDYFIVLCLENSAEYLSTYKNNLSEFVGIKNYSITYAKEIMLADIFITTNKQQAYYANVCHKHNYIFSGENNKFVGEYDLKNFQNTMEDSINLPRAFKEYEKLHGNSLHSSQNITDILLNDIDKGD